jgi:osmoprotectant transport system permease protein
VNGVIDWFRDGDHWHGASGVPTLLGQHALLTLVSTLMAIVLGLPLAVWLGHRGRGGTFAVNLSNIGRAIPIIALLSLLSLGVFGTQPFGPFGRSGVATLVTLALFALPPIVTNAYTGVIGVDRDVVEAARGMGMSELRVLRQVELPLALPLVVAGIRLAVVQVWATATIAALVAGPGLGRIIVHGYESFQTSEVVAGSLIVALVALALELTLSFVQKLIDPLPAGSR